MDFHRKAPDTQAASHFALHVGPIFERVGFNPARGHQIGHDLISAIYMRGHTRGRRINVRI